MVMGTMWVHGQMVVTGSVSDVTGPLPGVNLLVKGTNVGVSSDFDDSYSIEVPAGQDVLVFTFIGCQKNDKIYFDGIGGGQGKLLRMP